MRKYRIPNEKEFNDIWFNQLNEQQRKKRAKKIFKILRKIAYKQQAKLDSLKDTCSGNDVYGLMYFITTYNEMWNLADFMIKMGVGKWKSYAYYSARTFFENTFRLEYFIDKDGQEQSDLAIRELLRVCKRFYDFEVKLKSSASKLFKSFYDNFRQDTLYPDIDIVTMTQLKSFPIIYNLVENSNIPKTEDIYFHYRILSEAVHGSFFHSITRLDDSDNETYRRYLMYLILFAKDVLRFGSEYLSGDTKEEIEAILPKCDYILKRPPLSKRLSKFINLS